MPSITLADLAAVQEAADRRILRDPEGALYRLFLSDTLVARRRAARAGTPLPTFEAWRAALNAAQVAS